MAYQIRFIEAAHSFQMDATALFKVMRDRTIPLLIQFTVFI
jgi:hypothetical protein